MRGWRTVLSAAVVGVILIVAYAGLSGAAPSRSILLYNGQHLQLTTQLVTAFEKQTGIEVRVRTNDGIVLADQLLQEGSASPADVYLTENTPELLTLDEHGLLAKLDPSTLAEVPAQDEASDGDWAGVSLRISSLAYDPALVAPSQLPSSILALAQPIWKGKVAIAPTDSDFPPLVGAVVHEYGAKVAASWLAGLKRNAQLYQSDEAVVAAVSRGDVATGVINNYYWYRLRLEIGSRAVHSALYFFPGHNVGSVENISGVGVLATSKHPALAQAFVRFLLSRYGQEIIAHSDDFEYPTRPGVQPNEALPSLSSIAPAVLGASAIGNDQQAGALIQASGLA
jgi:iron(III) transport system substrate-binding protein